MTKMYLESSLQTAARDLVKSPDYLEDFVMWVYEAKWKVSKNEIIGDSQCPKSVQNYLEHGGTIRTLLKEAKDEAICFMLNSKELLCLTNIKLGRLFLKTPKSEIERLDINFTIPLLSVIVEEIIHMNEIFDKQEKMTSLGIEDEEILRRLHFYFD